MTINSRKGARLLPCNNTSTLSRASHIWLKGALVEVIMGQSTASVLRLICRKRTLWWCSSCWGQTACPLCFIRPSEIHWPSSIAQKGSISKPCPLQLDPGPLSVGKVFAAFVPKHRSQTAARHGQAADLYSRLCQSKAAQAQKQWWFEQQPCVYTVKGFLLLVCSHYLGSCWTYQAYQFHQRELTEEEIGRRNIHSLCFHNTGHKSENWRIKFKTLST